MPDAISEPEANRAFGSENRARLLAIYLDAQPPVSAAAAWRRVYELLLWIDRTTGLAHCYESDKCQPGRPWYGRSLRFHDWLCRQFEVEAGALGISIDWLFRAATVDLAQQASAKRLQDAAAQRQPYENRGFPVPGEDAELRSILGEGFRPYLAGEPDDQTWRDLTTRVQTHLGQENKRKNLLGEGFEDTLAAVIRRLPTSLNLHVANRVLLGQLPGFRSQGPAEKAKRVDLAIWTEGGDRRVLVTSKWSVRADREEQFGTDFDAYVRANAELPFDHVLVTNEFDAARLRAACNRLSGNAFLFSSVVHVNPDGVLAAYGAEGRGAASELPRLLDSGRLISIEAWLTTLLS
jgi:hypothetical protein